MGSKCLLLGAAAAAALAAQPAAAGDLQGRDSAGQRSSGFAGATLRLPLDGNLRRAARPRLAIGLSRVHERGDASGPVERSVAPGLELGLAGGRPLLLVGGAPAAEARSRLGIGTTHVVLAVAGLAAATFAVIELTDDNDEERICLIPEGCPPR